MLLFYVPIIIFEAMFEAMFEANENKRKVGDPTAIAHAQLVLRPPSPPF
jgi:hypothetical protein